MKRPTMKRSSRPWTKEDVQGLKRMAREARSQMTRKA
jgi:hypothetical protein